MLLLVWVMVNVPFWLEQPGVWPFIVKEPEPDPIPIAILPCMVKVFVDELPGGVQDIVMFIVPPFIIPCPI